MLPNYIYVPLYFLQTIFADISVLFTF